MAFKLEYKQKMYQERKHYLDSVKISSGCVDCKVNSPAEILSFDHVRGEKLFGIGQRWDVSRKKLDDEILKCEVVCHNCHAIRTNKRIQDGDQPPFIAFPKIPRLNRDIIVTEKIDGTNAIVWVDGDGDVWAGSKNKWLSTGKGNDNHGFAQWVQDREELFREKGPNVYRGEFWGNGIQRGYGLIKDDKRFSLFDTRWNDKELRPSCCSVVPILYQGPFSEYEIGGTLTDLKIKGSKLTPFMNPEGIVIFHTASNHNYKVTLEGDEKPKGLKE